MTIASTPGALFVVGGRAYVDSQTLHNLAHTHTVTPLAGGWRVLGDGGAVECLLSSRPALPEQHGSLYEARATAGAKVSGACATWLARGAARISGKYPDWPDATAGGCGARCGCAPCKQRHGQAHMSAAGEPPSPGEDGEIETRGSAGEVSHEDAAEYVLDAAPFRLDGYMPETETRQPSGFYLHLYPEGGDYEKKAVTFEVIDRDTLRIEWRGDPISTYERRRILLAIDLLIQEAYDVEEDP